MVEISVIIPTHNRADLLAKHLLLLNEQSLAPEKFEVIVVADGCTDDTASVVRQLIVPYRIRLLKQNPGTGAAGARNRGTKVARGGVLLFLDDDMEPHRDLLSAHLQHHRSTPGAVVLGYYPMQPPQADDSVFTRGARLWWAEWFAGRSRPDYRFSFYDLCSGNLSVAKDVFLRAGGFDESIGKHAAGEDYELGYRLMRQRVPFRFARNAETVHHSRPSFESSLRRAREDGYGQAVIVRKHRELFWEFNVCMLSRLSKSTVLRPVWVALWRCSYLADAPMAILRAFARLLLRTNVELFWKVHKILKAHEYWRGVKTALGSLSNWECLAQDAPAYEPANCHEVNLDISRDLHDLDGFVRERGPIDAIRVFVSGQPVGRIAPWPAAEAMNSCHVRAALVAQFSSVLIGQIAARGKFERISPALAVQPHQSGAAHVSQAPPKPNGGGTQAFAQFAG